MSSPILLPTAEQLEEIGRAEAEADRIFGEDSRAMRTILGAAISYLHDQGGPEATRAYVQRCLGMIRKLDLLDTPPAEGPKAS